MKKLLRHKRNCVIISRHLVVNDAVKHPKCPCAIAFQFSPSKRLCPRPCVTSVQISSPGGFPRFEDGTAPCRPAPRLAGLNATRSPHAQLKTKKRTPTSASPRSETPETAHQMRSDAKGSITACREELPAYALPEAPRLKFQKRLLLCEFDIILPWQKNGKAFARASVPA